MARARRARWAWAVAKVALAAARVVGLAGGRAARPCSVIRWAVRARSPGRSSAAPARPWRAATRASGGFGGGGVGEQGAPVPGQDHAFGAAPGGEAGADEHLGRGDPFGKISTPAAWPNTPGR